MSWSYDRFGRVIRNEYPKRVPGGEDNKIAGYPTPRPPKPPLLTNSIERNATLRTMASKNIGPRVSLACIPCRNKVSTTFLD